MSIMSVTSSLNFTSSKVNVLAQAIRSFSRANFSSLLNFLPDSEDGLDGDDLVRVVWRSSATGIGAVAEVSLELIASKSGGSCGKDTNSELRCKVTDVLAIKTV